MTSLKEMMSLEGRVAVITGGAGYLGGAMAEALAELGCSLCLVDRPGALWRGRCEQLQTRWQVSVMSLEIDLEQEADRERVPTEVVKHLRRADILINNAAFVGDSALQGWAVPFEQQHIGTWRRAIEVNLTASFHLAQLLTPMLKAHGNGSIINIGSIYGVAGPDNRLYEGTGMGNPAAYAASKGGVIQMTRWLSSVLAPEIRVNAISPGGIARGQAPEFVERYVARTPMKRMGTESDFKGAVAYFASDLSTWVTGENLMVDGGWTVW